jgi:hypothetical protein
MIGSQEEKLLLIRQFFSKLLSTPERRVLSDQVSAAPLFISSLLAASARSPTGISGPNCCLCPAPDMRTSPTLMLVTMEQHRRSYGVACAPGLAIMPQI